MRFRTSLAIVTAVICGACAIPRPPPHGPVAAPAPESANPDGLLQAVRTDYPSARVDAGPLRGDFRLSFGEGGQSIASDDAFVDAFVKRHSVFLAAGPTADAFVPYGKKSAEHVVFGSPLRDSGCRRIRLAFVLSPSGPVSMQRTCEPLRRAPPSYASRPLPTTASGPNDLIVRVGAIGGFAGPLFSGYVIDRFGDVYGAADYPGPYDTEPPAFIRDYIKTLPPAEVEQFAFDVALASAEKEQPEPESAPPVPDRSSPVVQAFVGPEGKAINLPYISTSAARRATRWARESVRR